MVVQPDCADAKIIEAGIDLRAQEIYRLQVHRRHATRVLGGERGDREIKISVVIDEKYLELAVRVLHQAFESDKGRGAGSRVPGSLS